MHIYNVLGLKLAVLAVCFLCAVYRYFLAKWIENDVTIFSLNLKCCPALFKSLIFCECFFIQVNIMQSLKNIKD